MRVIEHRTIQQKQQKRARQKQILKFGLFLVMLLTIGLLVFWLILKPTPNKSNITTGSTASVGDSGVAGAQANNGPLKYFTGEQFQKLYESMVFPNTQELTSAPIITGNKAADKRIIQIAESRGYVLRSAPILPIIKTDSPHLADDDLLQPKAFEDWLKLKQAAKNEGIPLKLNSGYRSIESQKTLFLQRLSQVVSPSTIAAGNGDAQVVKTLHVTAPPGFSRHHTGYTIDLICDDGQGRAFKYTKCFDWMKKENYKNAKLNGWIPSYPDGTDNQGPEPEPWEYVWVGQQAVRQN